MTMTKKTSYIAIYSYTESNRIDFVSIESPISNYYWYAGIRLPQGWLELGRLHRATK